ncbi:MAG TPA: amidohydrolase family protein [Ktedonobacterales bacterium]
MLDLPIVDAHVHLWDLHQFPRPWLGSLPALSRSFDLTDYRDQAAGLPVESVVFVETGVAAPYALLEAQWAIALAQRDPRLQGVVAAAPLEDGLQVRPHLEALAALGPLVKGVRRNLQDEFDPAFCLRREFIEGVHLLEAFGFSCDICIRHDQLPAVTALAGACPAVFFILDHLGKPAINQELLDPWREHVTALAALPNVACKISGLVTEADWSRWEPKHLTPYVAHALAVFGPRRVLFGSDWPVVTLASSYLRWVETLDAMTAQLSSDERRQMWSENARQWYRLPGLAGKQ